MNVESNPLVTIVVPSYNQGHFIEDTLKSILNQDYPNIEVIVMDGGSTDQTLDVLRRHEGRIIYFSERDRGQSDAINKGFRLAKGEIVAWLNSDDIYPDRLAVRHMVEAFSRYPESDFLYGNFIEIDKENTVLKIYKRPSYSFSRLLRIGYISQPATFFRNRVIQKMFVREDLRYAMDLEYWLRANELNFNFRHIKYLIAAERIHEDAKCVLDNSKMLSEARDVRKSFGAKFSPLYSIMRFSDKFLLYLLRLSALVDLEFYKRNPDRLTISLKFNGAIRRTLGFRIRSFI